MWDKENFYVVDCKGFVNHIPVTIEGFSITAYYSDNNNDILSVNKDTINSSTSDFKFVYTKSKLSLMLIIITALFAVSFFTTLAVKLVLDRKRRRLKP